MPFGPLTSLAADPVLSLTNRFRADPRARKIDLGVGVYRDERGQTPVFAAVKLAEAQLAATQTSKSYLGSEGNLEFIRSLGLEALQWRDAIGLQTVGGTGALRLAAELLAYSKPGRRLWMSVPTWNNHLPIFTAAGLNVTSVDSFDAAADRYRPEVLLDALRKASSGDAVLLHGCCHNPTGIDPDTGFWIRLAEVIEARGLIPLLDIAYQGLGQNWHDDAAGLRHLGERVPDLLVAYSCDKNFGLYRERVGALFVRTGTPAEAVTVMSHLVALARADYSMPPDHGAAVVHHILQDAMLSESWRRELDAMRGRLRTLRRLLGARGRVGAVDLTALAGGAGMFAMLPLSVAQIDLLQSEYGVYMAPSGRINIAGLGEAHIDTFEAALSAVQRKYAA